MKNQWVNNKQPYGERDMSGQAIITIGNKQWTVALASSPQELIQGLGGLASIPPGTGMLFGIGQEQNTIVTTAPMLFPLDMVFLELGKQVGIPDFHPHLLRHSRVRHLMEAKVPIERVSEIAGHRGLDTTLKIYGRLRAEELGKYLEQAPW
jgi:uncharacterized membrane protein (UPF0127 family)